MVMATVRATGGWSPVLQVRLRIRRSASRLIGGLCANVRSAVCRRAGWSALAAVARSEVEPPVHLVHNILAATSGVLSTRSFSATGGGLARRANHSIPRAACAKRWDSFFTPVAAFVRQPRFAMSFGMIFFSFSLALSAAGVKPKDVAKVGLRPTAMRHAYIDAQIKVVKYYDNIRFVYEIESKLRELKRANTPAEPGPEFQKQEQKDKSKSNTSGQPGRPQPDQAMPDERQDRNYSEDYDQPVLAALRTGAPITPALRDAGAVSATTDRRFV
jgi:hypothetical protein